jgi:hypothetical protein
MSAPAAPPVSPVMTTQGFAEPTIAFPAGPGGLDALVARLEEHGHEYRGPVAHDGGDRSLYVEDLEGNVVEVRDFFERGEGRREGAAALAGDDVPPPDTSS